MQRVSVIIPVFNKEKYIEETLLSIDKQITRGQFEIEIVLVDDCSTDNTLSVIENFEWTNISKDSVVVAKNSENRGPSFTFNAAFEKSTGDFIAILDADDLLVRLSLFTRFNYLQENTDKHWVAGNELFINLEGNFAIGKEFTPTRNLDGLENAELLEMFFQRKLVIGPHVIMGRREVFEEVKWNNNVRSIQDSILLIDLLLSKFKPAFIDDYVALYRNDEGMKSADSLYTRVHKSGQMVKDLETARSHFEGRIDQSGLNYFNEKIQALKQP